MQYSNMESTAILEVFFRLEITYSEYYSPARTLLVPFEYSIASSKYIEN